MRLFGIGVGAYVGLLVAIVAAGFLYQALGLWAAIIWGLMAVAGIVALIRRRRLRG